MPFSIHVSRLLIPLLVLKGLSTGWTGWKALLETEGLSPQGPSDLIRWTLSGKESFPPFHSPERREYLMRTPVQLSTSLPLRSNYQILMRATFGVKHRPLHPSPHSLRPPLLLLKLNPTKRITQRYMQATLIWSNTQVQPRRTQSRLPKVFYMYFF